MDLPQFDLSGRVAVVTGGGRSIGRATARLLASAGADVVVAGRDGAALARVAEEVAATTERRVLDVVCDVTDPEAVAGLLETCIRELGTPDVLVANAGVFQEWQPSAELTLAEWDRVNAVDLRGVWICCSAFGRAMLARGHGSIVTVGSIAGLVALPGIAAYNAAKAGVVALTKTLAAEWATRNVRVNCVVPGFIERDVEPLYDDPAALARILDRTPLRRFGTGDEVAAAVLFLASDASAYVIGATVAVDGGWLAV